jgi:hypothetical protein
MLYLSYAIQWHILRFCIKIYKNKSFYKWAKKEGIKDLEIAKAVVEMEQGLIGADLEDICIKKRVPLRNRGKSSGARTLVAYKKSNKAFFLYGFAKNERANISDRDQKALKELGDYYLSLSIRSLSHAIDKRRLFEVKL